MSRVQPCSVSLYPLPHTTSSESVKTKTEEMEREEKRERKGKMERKRENNISFGHAMIRRSTEPPV
ncbi:hypothetical protein J4Q44_G00262860 [Coregonus suidteri]|uniref:Uncharacterized protein n=1 Tax=Coregonus suidteri TaxID=861788 RepID=A0AAN8QW90_9TELE